MTTPVLMVVDEDAGSLGTLDAVLRRRYDHDYLVLSEVSPATALGRLGELRAAGHEVAVVMIASAMTASAMTASAMTAAPAAEFLAQVRTIQPAAKRVLVVPRGGPAAPSLRVPVPLVADRQAAMPVLRALAHGMIDAYLEPAAGGFTLRLAGGQVSHARTVLITTGVSYRRLGAPGLDSLLGAGVFYGAAASESSAFAGEHVFIAGGANSAGQAAVNLARYAQKVTIVVRGGSLAARMSQYLIDQISATPNINVRTTTQIAAGAGTGKMEALILQDTTTGGTQTVPASALVVLIGAVPHTGWLRPPIGRDAHGFIATGSDLPPDGNPAARWTLPRTPLPLEISMPGVFAAGDVRHVSVERVASAVGEGSIAATQMYQYLDEQAQSS